MSLNALAQYMTANAGRRERILRDQKYPPTFQVTWYHEATRAITRYLLDPDRETDILTVAEERLDQQPADGDNERQRLNDNATAIRSFAACCEDITFDAMTAQRPPQDSQLVIEGVTVSVRPDVILGGSHRGHESLGGVKIYLSKNERLDEDSASAVGALLHRYVSGQAFDGENCNVRHCTVVDVFGRTCASAPRAITRRQREIDAACREIAQRWATV
jgi:hypothetical protein